MSEVEIRFEREGLNGIVAVGSYLIDTIRRFGIRLENACEPPEGIHACAVIVTKGAENLSPLTRTETEHFALYGRRSNERLACESKIVKPGEVTIMTEQKREKAMNKTVKDPIQAEFEALPLEKKIANLLKMEVVTLGETFAYVVNSPFKVVEKVGDVIAEFGMKLENEAKKAARPGSASTEGTAKGPAPKPTNSSTKRPPGNRATKDKM